MTTPPLHPSAAVSENQRRMKRGASIGIFSLSATRDRGVGRRESRDYPFIRVYGFGLPAPPASGLNHINWQLVQDNTVYNDSARADSACLRRFIQVHVGRSIDFCIQVLSCALPLLMRRLCCVEPAPSYSSTKSQAIKRIKGTPHSYPASGYSDGETQRGTRQKTTETRARNKEGRAGATRI
jgi:hypothetical protein